MSALIGVQNGSVYLSADVVDRYFRAIDAVVVLMRDGDLQILPVRQMASGGCLLKVRNAAGDRVAAASDVFAANELLHWSDEALEAHWSSEHGALLAKRSNESKAL